MGAQLTRNALDAITHRQVNTIEIPSELRTERLHLRSWRETDAALLLPVLKANAEHLGGWIPAHVATPVPLPELMLRLAGFAVDFRAGRSWRFGMFSLDESDILGEVSLFTRSATGRVAAAVADRMEIGYWLAASVTGYGYATEAARAMLALATSQPGMRCAEIHCDPRNVRSAAVPQRLGFRLEPLGGNSTMSRSPGSSGQVWVHDLVKVGA
jgi:RimJ/RimL family protein N-acetyltransferase